MHKKGKAAALPVGAAVASEIFHKIIGDPYFAFRGGPQDMILQESQGKAFRNLLRDVATSDEAGAETLRCQLLRLLDPASNEEGEQVDGVKSVSKLSRRCAAKQLVAYIADTILPKLPKLPEEQSNRALTELETIVQQAAELSWSIWTRKSRVEVIAWPTPALLNQEVPAYHSKSKIYALHPLNNKDVDDDPTALDGCLPVLMCSPVVAAFGTADGKDYDQRVIIKKAVVWMEPA